MRGRSHRHDEPSPENRQALLTPNREPKDVRIYRDADSCTVVFSNYFVGVLQTLLLHMCDGPFRDPDIPIEVSTFSYHGHGLPAASWVYPSTTPLPAPWTWAVRRTNQRPDYYAKDGRPGFRKAYRNKVAPSMRRYCCLGQRIPFAELPTQQHRDLVLRMYAGIRQLVLFDHHQSDLHMPTIEALEVALLMDNL